MFFFISADGVELRYQITDEAPTGTCAVLVTGIKRSLCANLAAAQKFTQDHLAKDECKKSIQAAKFFYSSVSRGIDFLKLFFSRFSVTCFENERTRSGFSRLNSKHVTLY